MSPPKKGKVVDTATRAVKPKMPKVDKPQAFENATRMLFTTAVDDWVKENIDGKVDKELRGSSVDDLTAMFGSAVETLVTAATHCYLDAAFDDDEDDGDGEDGEDGDDDDDGDADD